MKAALHEKADAVGHRLFRGGRDGPAGTLADLIEQGFVKRGPVSASPMLGVHRDIDAVLGRNEGPAHVVDQAKAHDAGEKCCEVSLPKIVK